MPTQQATTSSRPNHARASSKEAPRRATFSGDPAAEARIAEDLRTIRATVDAALGDRLRALLLLGSYARAEGGVAYGPGGPGPANDYDLVALVRGPLDARLRAQLGELSHALTAAIGVEVDLWPMADGRGALTLPPTLLWLDASLGGCRTLLAREGVKVEPGLRPRDIPLEEAGRLLANRAVGIALSRLYGSRGVPCPERAPQVMLRHVHKMALACGDAWLLAIDGYEGGLRARLARLRALEGTPTIEPGMVDAYAFAVDARLRPLSAPPRPIDVERCFELLRPAFARWHLGFEAFRVGAPQTPAGYAAMRQAVYPRLADVALPRMAALRAAACGDAPLWPWRGHPRERLARVAVLLAHGERDEREEAARLLGMSAAEARDDARLRERLLRLARRGG
jgi:hypothetical protein